MVNSKEISFDLEEVLTSKEANQKANETVAGSTTKILTNSLNNMLGHFNRYGTDPEMKRSELIKVTEETFSGLMKTEASLKEFYSGGSQEWPAKVKERVALLRAWLTIATRYLDFNNEEVKAHQLLVRTTEKWEQSLVREMGISKEELKALEQEVAQAKQEASQKAFRKPNKHGKPKAHGKSVVLFSQNPDFMKQIKADAKKSASETPSDSAEDSESSTLEEADSANGEAMQVLPAFVKHSEVEVLPMGHETLFHYGDNGLIMKVLGGLLNWIKGEPTQSTSTVRAVETYPLG